MVTGATCNMSPLAGRSLGCCVASLLIGRFVPRAFARFHVGLVNSQGFSAPLPDGSDG